MVSEIQGQCVVPVQQRVRPRQLPLQVQQSLLSQLLLTDLQYPPLVTLGGRAVSVLLVGGDGDTHNGGQHLEQVGKLDCRRADHNKMADQISLPHEADQLKQVEVEGECRADLHQAATQGPSAPQLVLHHLLQYPRLLLLPLCCNQAR